MDRECFPEVVSLPSGSEFQKSPPGEEDANAIFGRVHAILFGKILVHEELVVESLLFSACDIKNFVEVKIFSGHLRHFDISQ